MKAGRIAQMHPFHYIVNLMGLIVFPFLASPMLKKVGHINDEEFVKMVKERKKLIPMWMMTIMTP